MINAPNINKNRLTVLFWLRNKINKRGLQPIYCRTTLNGVRATEHGFCTGVYLKPDAWDSTFQMVKGNHEPAEVDNQILLQIKTDLKRILAQHELAGGEFTALDIQNAYLGRTAPAPKYTLADLKKLWDKRFKGYVESGEKSQRSFEAYDVHHQEILSFFGKEKKLLDFKLSDWEEFRLHLTKRVITKAKNVGNTTHQNTVAKYMISFRGLFEVATEYALIPKNPFFFKKSERTRPEKVYLSYPKIVEMQKLQPQQDSEIQKAIDIFLFCAHSGLNYQDYASLTNESLMMHEEKQYIYLPYRYKSPLKNRYGKSYIPLFPELQRLITKYGSIENLPKDPDANRKLKFVWGAINAPRNMCLKNARHSFINHARTNLGIPEATLIMIVGHSSVRTTEDSYLDRNLETLTNDLKKLNLSI